MKKEKKFVELDDFKLEKLKGGKIPRPPVGEPCWDCPGGSAEHPTVKVICKEVGQVDLG